MNSIGYDLNRHLTFRIARLQARLNAQASELLNAYAQISLSEWRILAVLSNPSVKTQKDVLNAMGLDKGQISRTLKRLEGRGLINMAWSKSDQRQRQVSLAPGGVEIVDKMSPIMMKRQAYLQSDISASDIDLLFELIGKLEANAGPISPS